MKYQIILESEINMPDDEFENMFKVFVLPQKFKLIEARSLDGIRKEVWEKKEELKYVILHQNNDPVTTKLDETFEDISNLFKIKE